MPGPHRPRSNRTRHALAALPAEHSRVTFFPVREHLVGFIRDDDEEVRLAFRISFCRLPANLVLHFDDATLDELRLRIREADHHRADKSAPSADELAFQARDLVNECQDLSPHFLRRRGDHHGVERVVRGVCTCGKQRGNQSGQQRAKNHGYLPFSRGPPDGTPRKRAEELVGTPRFELGTPCTPCKCATRLRHVPPEKPEDPRERGLRGGRIIPDQWEFTELVAQPTARMADLPGWTRCSPPVSNGYTRWWPNRPSWPP